MKVNVVIVGAGAAGLMCAIEAGKRGRSVLVLERNSKIGEKIRISGGGRCNFTNLNADHANYISQNEHFCKSALARFTTTDFIALLKKHGIKYHEKKLGQLFCDGSSQQILKLLQEECDDARVEIKTSCRVSSVSKQSFFSLSTDIGTFESESLVIATGGLSIPKLGATSFGYKIAHQFGLKAVGLKPGLVPLKFHPKDVSFFRELSGVSIDTVVSHARTSFRENILFTHRGLSGPAILQISSYWNRGDAIVINLLPDIDIFAVFLSHHQSKMQLSALLDKYLPKRFVQKWLEAHGDSKPVSTYSRKELQTIAHELTNWKIIPSGTEGYEKAEVTVGGVDTNELSSKTMEAKKVQGLYFVGEVVDVTGWLGGFNFQWAWASGWVAGQYV